MKLRLSMVHVYVGVGLAITIAAIAIITSLAAQRQNNQSLATQRIVADFDTQDAFDYLQGQTRQMVYWQDAFENIVHKWNQPWVSYQFGPYQDTMGNHLVAIVGPNRDLRFLHAKAADRSFTPKNFINANGLNALLGKTLRAGLQRPPPIPEGIIVVGGKPYYAVAALITPEEDKDVGYARSHPFFALFMRPVTVAQYSGFAAGFEAEDVRITTDQNLKPGEVHFALNDAAAKPIAYVQWKPILPGDDFLESITIPLGLVLLLFTVTQLLVLGRWMKLQRRLIRAEAESTAAKEQSRLKSVFLGTISHELRTPLNAVIGYADALCNQIFGPLGSPRNHEYVHDIRDSGRKLLATVNDLIEIARIEARDTGKGEDLFEVTAAVRQAILAVCPMADTRNTVIELATHGEEPWCRGSTISLAQALERILDNAVRYSPPSNAVAVTVRREMDEVLIEVRDHGNGIPQDRLECLARPFGHSDNHLVAQGSKGMGFGLPIARGLIELMGGTLEIESESGVGTTVRIRLPAQNPPQAAADAPAGSTSVPGVIWTGRGRDYVAHRIASNR